MEPSGTKNFGVEERKVENRLKSILTKFRADPSYRGKVMKHFHLATDRPELKSQPHILKRIGKIIDKLGR